jgi:hypothetical protein
MLALGVAAIHAFTPMYLFISGSVNNDNLVVPLSSLALLMLLQLLRTRTPAKVARSRRDADTLADPGGARPEEENLTFARGVPLARYLFLGLVLGLAVLTKTNSLALTVLTAIVVLVRAVRRRSWVEFLLGGLATLLPVLAISGWWFLRNLRLYGDLTGFSAFFAILGTRDVPADLAQLWRERFSFLAGYWGNFGGLNVPMSAWVYRILNTLTLLAALGLLILLLRRLLSTRTQSLKSAPPTASSSSWSLDIGHWSFPLRPSSSVLRPLSSDIGHRTSDSEHRTLDIDPCSLLLCLLWALGVFLPWLGWARVTWSSQGRLIFPAISVWSLLLALGLLGWLPLRWGRWAVAAFALFLLGLSVAAPFVWIRPAYAYPQPLTGTQIAAIPAQVAVGASGEPAERFGGLMRLLGYDVGTDVTQPGGQVEVTLYWDALAPADRDYTVFVHLLGEGDLLVAQRDTFPGLGRLSTTWLEPGFRWADRYVLQVPGTSYAPDVAQIEVGLYDAVTGSRLPVTTPDGEPAGDNARFGQVEIRPLPGEIPNPISVNFGDRLALVGYDLDQRLVRPGDAVALTLYWRGLREMDVDYTVSVQLVDAAQHKAAQRDGWPLEGSVPTSTWEPDQLHIDPYALEVFPDATPGVYDLRVAVYVLEDGSIVHVPVIPAGGQMLADHQILTRVRVLP